ncbi:uncharacterized protein LOC128736506 [Sabethes cyaneus]|uniref:uncharacterized protein LOC128736506 n=1 Tax=Sabethes cyaneus TaxID=53552 RepID=UPI00237D7AC0|nr:uncharacterized protein LOC128736506 [Sabethes cyaneus]
MTGKATPRADTQHSCECLLPCSCPYTTTVSTWVAYSTSTKVARIPIDAISAEYNSNAQKRSYLKNLDTMDATLDALQQLLTKCRTELLTYRNQFFAEQESNAFSNTSLRRETELLKVQLETYKSNLAEERVAHQALLLENNQLVGLLKQKQNQDMHVEAFNGHMEQAGHRDNNSSRESSAPAQISQHDGHLERHPSHCSLCNKVFVDFQSLETHIDDCPAY